MRKGWNNIKLGAFVFAGLILLIAGLYLIGKDTNLFSKNYLLKAQFSNVEGLIAGNNVRFGGIQIGTVKKVEFIRDTVIEVTMTIDQKMQTLIKKNDIASIGTDGLMGNKIVNITPAKMPSPLAREEDILPVHEGASTEEMLNTLAGTNKNLSVITEQLKKTIQEINTSENLKTLLHDKRLPQSVMASLHNIQLATDNAYRTIADLHLIIADVKAGKGSVGELLRDSTFSTELNKAVAGLQIVETRVDTLALQLSGLVKTIQSDLATGKGPVPAALHDSLMVKKVHSILSHVDTSTIMLNENLEAMRHNFLFRGYFKKQEKEKQKQAAAIQH
jgi:phospholipid/cholesterol/gamma-HCH transport system substrate-binding protein